MISLAIVVLFFMSLFNFSFAYFAIQTAALVGKRARVVRSPYVPRKGALPGEPVPAKAKGGWNRWLWDVITGEAWDCSE